MESSPAEGSVPIRSLPAVAINEAILALADTNPKALRAVELRYVVELVKSLRSELAVALAQDGRIHGILEAVEFLREASRRDQRVRILFGKKQVFLRSINTSLLLRVARILEDYAGALQKSRQIPGSPLPEAAAEMARKAQGDGNAAVEAEEQAAAGKGALHPPSWVAVPPCADQP